MQARVTIVGATRGLEQLTYSVPAAFESRLAPGHRVLVPLRSRRVTAMVTEIGEELTPGPLKPVLEMMEERPLFDDAHLRLMDFLANYYMVPLTDAYRSVIPSVARVESKLNYRLAHSPNPLRRAAFTEVERKVVETLGLRPLSASRLEKLGSANEIRSTVARLLDEGLIERFDSTRGRHRETSELLARLKNGVDLAKLRGTRQREIVGLLASSGDKGITVEQLCEHVQNARATLKAMARRGVVEMVTFPRDDRHANSERPTNVQRESSEGAAAGSAAPELSIEQKAACDAILPAVRQSLAQTFLLWGVTASGKTEIYLKLAAAALDGGRNVLVMVPEIALADELVRGFRARFGAAVGLAHSAQNVAERWGSWMAALGGDSRIMIGPRSVIFAPIHNLGLVVVDEEHDAAYKNEEGIRYHARDLAVAMGGFAKCPVVLGSATPSCESFANARRGKYRLLRMLRRVNDRAFAEAQIIDLRRELAPLSQHPHPTHAARSSASPDVRLANSPAAGEAQMPDPVPLSATLKDALAKNLAEGGQALVFLNRRGFHNLLQCSICGNVIACANCSVSMTFHMRDRSLRCHYCGDRIAAPEACPECRGFGLS
ncbi:MAG TPA: primosomal protein N', partial [Candidatus Binatus sp.]|nr:primosomal protein N' [Candidatus Binatus sp.]